jgi:iron(III) transport system ATP-binding protein
MGANNTINGLITDVDGDSACVKGDGWSLRGKLRAPLKAGDRTTAVVRLEKIKLAQTPKENSLRLPLTASLYLGNAWEYVFDMGGTTIRGYGNEFMSPGEQLVDIPADHLWLF